MKLRIKRLSDSAVLPEYAHPGDAGMDLFSDVECVILPHQSVLVGTGIAIELPPDTEAQIRPRSGLALKHQVTVLNSPGTIDSGYRGEVGIILINHGESEFHVVKGDKIAQMVISNFLAVELLLVDNLWSSSRSDGGFGSTGTASRHGA